jgi:hypothetical protein
MDLNAVDFDAVLGLDEVHKTDEGADKLEDTVEKNEPATATTGTSPFKTTPAVVEQVGTDCVQKATLDNLARAE